MSLHTLITHCLGEREPLALARSQAEGLTRSPVIPLIIGYAGERVTIGSMAA